MFIRLRHALNRTAVRIAGSVTGQSLVTDHEPTDLFLVGFPRSGHTWCQYLIAGLTCGIDTSRCPDSLIQEIVPDMQSLMTYRRHTSPMFFKTHALPDPAYRRVVYLLRDGRDAMVSYFHYYNARVGRADFATVVREIPGLEARWHEHVEAWMANPHGAELLVVKYEDLRRDPVHELRRIAAFAGNNAPEAALLAAASNAGFEKQQHREKSLGWADAAWPKDKAFIRRGMVGSFRDEMPAEVLELFLREARPTLERHGYRT